MTVEHFIDVELDEDNYPSSVRFVCTGTADDICHRWCAEGCEESCTDSHYCETACEEPCGREGQPHRWEPISDGTSCRIVDWLDAVGWQDSGWHDDPELGDVEITAEQLRPGRHRIEEEWTGDDYIWRYPESA